MLPTPNSVSLTLFLFSLLSLISSQYVRQKMVCVTCYSQDAGGMHVHAMHGSHADKPHLKAAEEVGELHDARAGEPERQLVGAARQHGRLGDVGAYERGKATIGDDDAGRGDSRRVLDVPPACVWCGQQLSRAGAIHCAAMVFGWDLCSAVGSDAVHFYQPQSPRGHDGGSKDVRTR